MGLNNNTDRPTYVNISKGRLFTKEKDKLPVYFTDIDGTITGISFEENEYKGDKFEIVKVSLIDNGDKYVLQMRTDSGYFRTFVNSLKMGNPTERLNIAPSYKEVDEKPQATIFVKQYGKPLKHFYTKEKQGDLPQMESVTFKGKVQWDATKQIEFWKKWLLSIRFTHEAIAGTPTPLVPIDEINSDSESDLPF